MEVTTERELSSAKALSIFVTLPGISGISFRLIQDENISDMFFVFGGTSASVRTLHPENVPIADTTPVAPDKSGRLCSRIHPLHMLSIVRTFAGNVGIIVNEVHSIKASVMS